MANFGEIMKSEIRQTPEIFTQILQNQLFESKLVSILKSNEISSILLLARGTSDNAAFFFKYLVETQIGLPCGLTSPSSVSIYKSKLKYKNTLVVAISQSGKSTDLVQFANASKKSGAKLVAMTNDVNSPLASEADFHIPLMAGPELAVAATKSYSAQLLNSYLLVMKWADKPPLIDKLVSESNRILSESFHIKKIVEKIDLRKEIVVLGRGFAYPNAKEAALKIQETCKVNVHGMSTADYLHGPISALNSDTQVIMMAPHRMPGNSIEEAIRKIRELTSNIFWIGNGSEIETGEHHLGGSYCDDEITSSIVDTIVLQELSLYLSVANGYNPDLPKGLSKVTLTI